MLGCCPCQRIKPFEIKDKKLAKINELEKNGACFDIIRIFHGNRGSECVKMYGKLSYAKLQEKIKALEKDAIEYRQAENILRENGKKYKELAELLPQTLFEIDLTGNLTFSNRNAPQSFGYAQGVFDKGLNAMELFVPEDRDRFSANKKRTLRGNNTGGSEYTMLRKDGSTFPVVIYSNPMSRDGKSVGLKGIIIDISEVKKKDMLLRESERKLRLLSSHLLTVQERERRRISMELHDEVGQSLTVLKLQIRSIKNKLNDSQTDLKEDCVKILKCVDQTIENVRRFSRDFGSSILEDLGLSAALRWLAEDFEKHSNVNVSLDIAKIDNLFSRESQIIIYRIFQEAITNIDRHAHADHISIVIMKKKKYVFFQIVDDGKGFEKKQIDNRGSDVMGLGLTAMYERARMLGGTLKIFSRKQRGTRITLNVPICEKGK
jgi:PAS domain S-box-containing protein